MEFNTLTLKPLAHWHTLSAAADLAGSKVSSPRMKASCSIRVFSSLKESSSMNASWYKNRDDTEGVELWGESLWQWMWTLNLNNVRSERTKDKIIAVTKNAR